MGEKKKVFLTRKWFFLFWLAELFVWILVFDFFGLLENFQAWPKKCILIRIICKQCLRTWNEENELKLRFKKWNSEFHSAFFQNFCQKCLKWVSRQHFEPDEISFLVFLSIFCCCWILCEEKNRWREPEIIFLNPVQETEDFSDFPVLISSSSVLRMKLSGTLFDFWKPEHHVCCCFD